jgi:hypothetical protein
MSREYKFYRILLPSIGNKIICTVYRCGDLVGYADLVGYGDLVG